MSKKKIIDAVQNKYPNLTKKEVGTLIDATFNTISSELNVSGNKFSYQPPVLSPSKSVQREQALTLRPSRRSKSLQVLPLVSSQRPCLRTSSTN